MQCMLLIYDNERAFTSLSKDQLSKVMQAYGEFNQSIVKSGHFRAGAQLWPTSTATTLRQENGKVVTVDGPVAETKEQLGGYYLIECRDLDEALVIAKRIPSVHSGSIEVRPLAPMSEAAKTVPAR
jgi:hypothetical protein